MRGSALFGARVARLLIGVSTLSDSICRACSFSVEIHDLKPVQADRERPPPTVRTLTTTEPRATARREPAEGAIDNAADDWRRAASAWERAEARRALLPEKEAAGDVMRMAEAVGRTEHAEAIMAEL